MRHLIAGLAAAFMVIAIPALALAQSASPAEGGAAGAGEAASTEALALRRRVEQLEKQMLDMQVVIGTLESLARGGGVPTPGASAGAAALGGNSEARLRILETQVQALSAQVAQLAAQLRAATGGAPAAAGASPTAPTSGEVGTGAVVGSGRPSAPGAAAAPTPTVPVSPVTPGGAATGAAGPSPSPSSAPVGGTGGDPIGAFLTEATPAAAGMAPGEDPSLAYKKAYGLLLEQDYGAAEAAFVAFLKKHPKAKLAGNAQYWYGESLYVQGKYRAAANAFLVGYRKYRASPKAPDSLLKLGMSLRRLGKRDAACATLSELQKEFANAPAHIKRRAQSENRAAGC